MATSALRIIHGLPANSLPASGTGCEMHRECTGVGPFCTLPGPAGFQDRAGDEGLMFVIQVFPAGCRIFEAGAEICRAGEHMKGGSGSIEGRASASTLPLGWVHRGGVESGIAPNSSGSDLPADANPCLQPAGSATLRSGLSPTARPPPYYVRTFSDHSANRRKPRAAEPLLPSCISCARIRHQDPPSPSSFRGLHRSPLAAHSRKLPGGFGRTIPFFYPSWAPFLSARFYPFPACSTPFTSPGSCHAATPPFRGHAEHPAPFLFLCKPATSGLPHSVQQRTCILLLENVQGLPSRYRLLPSRPGYRLHGGFGRPWARSVP